MEQNYIKKFILSLLIMSLIIAVILVVLIIYLPKQESNKVKEEEVFNNKTPLKMDYSVNYFIVERYIGHFVEYVKDNNTTAIKAISDEENFFDNVDFTEELKVEEMYLINNDYSITYFVNAKFCNNNYYIVVINDLVNNTYKITKISEQEYFEFIQGQNTAQYSKYFKVKKNKFNNITFVYLDSDDLVGKDIDVYIKTELYNPENAYERLDEEYKKIKFENFDNYLSYVSNKSEELTKLGYIVNKNLSDFESDEEYLLKASKNNILEYHSYKKDDIEYKVYIDLCNNYYILKGNETQGYKVLLDTYTIDLPELVEEYENADSREKVMLNIKKIFQALNDKDYNYVYGKLDENFKTNTIGSSENFKTIMQNNFFEKNIVIFNNFEEKSNVYKYNISVLDSMEETQKSKTLNVIIQLGEGSNFTVKFE